MYEYVIPCSAFNTKKIGEALTAEEQTAVLAKVMECCKKMKGTHNFHNYSRKMKATDPSSKRYILDMQATPFKIQTSDYFLFTITGQSFIYHQIRKMIGVIVQIFHEDLTPDFIDNTFFNNVIKLWLAPPQGLLLNRVNFDGYNNKIDIPEKLVIKSDEESKMLLFKNAVLYPLIHEAESLGQA